MSLQLHKLRKEFAKSKRQAQTKEEARAGKLRSRKQTNLFPVRLLDVEGSLTFDHDKWAQGVVSEFEEHRWASVDSHDERLFKSLNGDGVGNLVIAEEMVCKAASKVKRPLILDANGVCVQAIRECPEIQRALCKPLQDMLNTDAAWHQRTELGYIKSKVRDARYLKDCRGVFPQTAMLQFLTMIVELALSPFCNLHDLKSGL